MSLMSPIRSMRSCSLGKHVCGHLHLRHNVQKSFLRSYSVSDRESRSGKVFVFSGILPICKNEDGLAAVLGHEIAHNVAHHAAEKASLPYLMALVAGIVTFFIDNSAQLTQLVLNLGVDLPNSRAQEV